MNSIRLATALAAASVMLAACQTTDTSNPHLSQGKAISAGWSGLKFAEDSADALVLSGKLSGAQAAKVSADIKQAHAVMLAADQAYRANTATDVSSQIAEAAALAAEVLTIVSAHK